jgi:hypothetical protein
MHEGKKRGMVFMSFLCGLLGMVLLFTVFAAELARAGMAT